MKINLLFQNILLLSIGLSINLIAFLILDFIVQNGFTALFNLATIYPLLGVPVFSIAVIAMCSVVVNVLRNN